MICLSVSALHSHWQVTLALSGHTEKRYICFIIIAIVKGQAPDRLASGPRARGRVYKKGVGSSPRPALRHQREIGGGGRGAAKATFVLCFYLVFHVWWGDNSWSKCLSTSAICGFSHVWLEEGTAFTFGKVYYLFLHCMCFKMFTLKFSFCIVMCIFFS